MGADPRPRRRRQRDRRPHPRPPAPHPAHGRAAAARQICQDRANLQAQGFAVTNFAYPFGDFDATTQSIVGDCGYDTGRGVSGIVSPNGCFNCDFAETIPPQNRLATRTPAEPAQHHDARRPPGVRDPGRAARRRMGAGGVPRASATGCDAYSTSPAQFAQFLDWLQPRAANGTVVRTVRAGDGRCRRRRRRTRRRTCSPTRPSRRTPTATRSRTAGSSGASAPTRSAGRAPPTPAPAGSPSAPPSRRTRTATASWSPARTRARAPPRRSPVTPTRCRRGRSARRPPAWSPTRGARTGRGPSSRRDRCSPPTPATSS